MRTEIIVCEGSSEKAYVQALNRILYRGSDAWPLPAFRPELAGQGCYSSVVKTFKVVVGKNKNARPLIWVDRDIYLRNERDSETNYRNKPAGIPDFLFSTMNFEDFLTLHCENEIFESWLQICQAKNHFRQPMTAKEYLPLFLEIFPDYKKGDLPFIVCEENVRRMIRRLQDPEMPFQNDFGTYLGRSIELKELNFI